MAFKPTTWYPIAVVLSVVNLVGAGFALGQAQPEHATIHAALAVAFGLWARRLRPRPGGKELPDGSELQDRDRKSTRLNSSHTVISYAVFCLKKKTKYDR